MSDSLYRRNIASVEPIFGRMKTALKERANAPQGLTLNRTELDWRAAMQSTDDRCSISGCPRAPRTRGMCAAHYKRVRRAELRALNPITRTSAADRFRAGYTQGRPDACWEWERSRKSDYGHGVFTIGRQKVPAARYALELATGRPAPEGMFACHTCDNPPCVNPAHLYWGDHGQNVQDAVDRARFRHGEEHAVAKLTVADVARMRELRAAGATYPDLASQFNVDKTTVYAATTGKTWRRAPGPITPSKEGRHSRGQ